MLVKGLMAIRNRTSALDITVSAKKHFAVTHLPYLASAVASTTDSPLTNMRIEMTKRGLQTLSHSSPTRTLQLNKNTPAQVSISKK